MEELLNQIEEIGLVPVVKIDRVENAVPLAKALYEGGLPCAEITFRTDAAAESIRAITKAYPDMLIGAGTVLTVEQADAAIEAGSRFLVSPGLNPDIVRHCNTKGYLIIPGVSTPSEVEQAISLGHNVVKFFPAESAGGLSMIKAMSAPYSKVRFMPTGGVNTSNLNSYLDYPKIIACGGSWMVNASLIKSKDFDTIRTLTRQAVLHMLGFTFEHIGINSKDEMSAKTVSDIFTNYFGFKQREIEVSYFAGEGIEVMKNTGAGSLGHIAIKTNYLFRAVGYLKRKGINFKMDTAKYNSDGKINFVYLADEIGGFAVHLVQR
jgi:2-dehydro-3-deoxyphosphogluconate aldolase/(4S)-4-hydroxy-2-oxoglutarate aldolase